MMLRKLMARRPGPPVGEESLPDAFILQRCRRSVPFELKEALFGKPSRMAACWSGYETCPLPGSRYPCNDTIFFFLRVLVQ